MRLTQVLLARYFRNYVERELTHETLRRQWKPIIGWKEHVRKDWDYGEHRPWTQAFKDANKPNTRLQRIFVEPIKEWHIFKGDRVEILVGKDKGKQGLVNCVIKERNWVYVEGLNCEYHMQQRSHSIMPMCVKNEKPLLVTTQVRLVDPADEKPTEIEWRYTESGDRVRVSVKSGRIIPLPVAASELEDFVNPTLYEETDKDTKEDDLKEVTFRPKLCMFEDDIMNAMGIKEDRKWPKMYYY